MYSKPSSSRVYPKAINHIAVSVPNLEEAMKWYTEILGFTVIKPPVEIVADDSLIGIA
jgi:catechol 2,3-dioxygenase-like lactoylglutathione lyase family enzyme